MMHLGDCRDIAETVNEYSEAKLNFRLKELRAIVDRDDLLTFDEQTELTYICLKVLSIRS